MLNDHTSGAQTDSLSKRNGSQNANGTSWLIRDQTIIQSVAECLVSQIRSNEIPMGYFLLIEISHSISPRIFLSAPVRARESVVVLA